MGRKNVRKKIQGCGEKGSPALAFGPTQLTFSWTSSEPSLHLSKSASPASSASSSSSTPANNQSSGSQAKDAPRKRTKPPTGKPCGYQGGRNGPIILQIRDSLKVVEGRRGGSSTAAIPESDSKQTNLDDSSHRSSRREKDMVALNQIERNENLKGNGGFPGDVRVSGWWRPTTRGHGVGQMPLMLADCGTRVKDSEVVSTAFFLIKVPHVILCTYGYMKENTLRVKPRGEAGQLLFDDREVSAGLNLEDAGVFWDPRRGKFGAWFLFIDLATIFTRIVISNLPFVTIAPISVIADGSH
ncbi:hypothetical protein BC829DRAFT_441986 [Chytridium lagenaria]|nr:hypothetical protein BC829DRAFT_441986 [Chytridium lagenaria]